MKILVTGGAGFIGSHTVDALIEKGYSVRVLDNLQKPVHLKGIPQYINPKVEYIWGDVRNRSDFEEALENIEAVFHFAAYQDYLPDFSNYFLTNAVSTALLFELIVKNNYPVNKVIVASSQAVMGEGLYGCKEHGEFVPGIRLEEQLAHGDWGIKCPRCGKNARYNKSDESIIKPENQYAMSKYSQEIMALNFGKRYDIPSVALRYSIVQGPRQSFYNAYSGAMRIFSLYLYFNESPVIYEDGNQVRDFVNIKDVVKANLIALESDRANNNIFNVGGGKPISVKVFYQRMLDIYYKDIPAIIDGSYRYGDTRNIYSDVSKLKSLGWEPEFSIDDSIVEYKNFLENQESIENILEYTQHQMKQLNVVRKSVIN